MKHTKLVSNKWVGDGLYLESFFWQFIPGLDAVIGNVLTGYTAQKIRLKEERKGIVTSCSSYCVIKHTLSKTS